MLVLLNIHIHVDEVSIDINSQVHMIADSRALLYVHVNDYVHKILSTQRKNVFVISDPIVTSAWSYWDFTKEWNLSED